MDVFFLIKKIELCVRPSENKQEDSSLNYSKNYKTKVPGKLEDKSLKYTET